MLTDLCRLGTDKTAAPAAVFPSASPTASPNWRRLDYLAHGNPRQRSAHALLTAGVWDELAAQCSDLALVSTLAIGLDRPGSDLDILCQHPDPAEFAARLEAQGWQASAKGDNVWLLERTFPRLNQSCADSGSDKSEASWPVELYVTPAPIETLNGWRHLTLMAALLERFGDAFYQEVLRLRLEEGLKGEAAMCRLLGLAGDPYEALLTLEGQDLAHLVWPAAIATPEADATSSHGSAMRTLFISDIHLCSDRPDMTAALVHFLAKEAVGADALYVLGDLFEFWIGDDDPNPLHQEMADAFLALSQQNVPIYFIHGNRDFLLGQEFAKRAGITLLGDPCVIELYGERVVLSHGDLLCTLDEGYQKFRRITQLKWLRWLFLRLPLARRQAIARKMRGQSQMENAHKSQRIMDVTPAAVDEMLRQHGCQVMIHGHTHRPAIHHFQLDGAPARRIVLGDWFEQGSVLVCRPGEQQLEIRPLAAAS